MLPDKSVAISVRGVSKRFRIATGQGKYLSLREVVTNGVTALLRRKRRESKYNFTALSGVSFEIKKGQVVGIIGKNGAGKSTLLKVLSRIMAPTTGTVVTRGRVGSLLEVGTGFHPELSGRENIFLNGAILGMTKKEIKEKFEEIVAFSEIGKFIDTPVKHYSSGMYVRLAFAVASHLETEILIIDEVLAVGDVVFQKKCLGKIRDVVDSGRTVLFVSHSLGLVKSLCSRVILLDKGKIVADGPTDKVIEKYMSITSNGALGAEKRFEKNKNKDGQIFSLGLYDAQMRPISAIKMGTGGWAVLDFEFRRRLRNTDVGVMISQAGQIIWIGLDNDANADLLLSREPGRHKMRVKLPTHVLMPGVYHLGVSMGFVGVGPIDNRYFEGINFEIVNLPTTKKQRVQRPEKGGVISYIKEWEQYAE